MNLQRVVVAGGLGFIGSAFVRMLYRERPGIAVTVLDACTYAGNPANLASIANEPTYRFVRGDIGDRAAVESAIGEGCDALVNFAAETHVDRSILDPEAFLRTGVHGVFELLEATRRQDIGRFVQVSTDEVYGDVASGTSTERDPLRPRSPYAASKAAGDLLALSYHTTYATPVIVTRGSNTYGPYQYPEKLIPLFITNLLEAQPLPLYGDGMNVREWLHVEDHAAGILHALEHGSAGEVYNLGGGVAQTNRAITEQLVTLAGRSWADAVRHVRDREGHDHRYALDASKAHELGWAPAVPFEAGLRATFDWYRENEAWWRPLKSGAFRAYYERQYAERWEPIA